MHGDDDYTEDWRKANAPEGAVDGREGYEAPPQTPGDENVAGFGSRRRFTAGGLNQNAIRGIVIGVGVFLFIIVMSVAWLILPKGGSAVASPNATATPIVAADRPGATTDNSGDVTLTPAQGTTTAAPIATVRPLATPAPARPYQPPPVAYEQQPPPMDASAGIPLRCRRELSPSYVGEISPVCSQYATSESGGGGTRVAAAPVRYQRADGPTDDQKAAADALKASSLMRSDYTPDNGSGTTLSGATSPMAAAAPGSAQDVAVSQGPESGVYRVRTGWRIPVALTSSVDMEMPGGVTAQVKEDVLDTLTGRFNLIPFGSTLVGVNGTASTNKRRADITWTLLRLPNGHEVPLARFSGQDALGRQGLDARVDDHRGRIARTSFISAALAAGAGILANRQQLGTASNGGVVVVSTGQQVGTVVADGILRTGDRLVQLDSGLPPSISVDAGTEFNVFVDKDIVLPPYAAATAAQ